MKKLLFICLFTLSITNAQTESFDSSKLKYEFSLGYNFATQITDFGEVDSGGKDKANGLIFGAHIKHPLTEKIDLRLSTLYSSIKNNNTEKGGSSVAFLMIPILGEYNIKDKISALAGPQINYSLSEMGANTKKATFAFSLGSIYKINNNIYAQAMYNIGLSNMIDFPGYSAKIHFLHFSIGYQL